MQRGLGSRRGQTLRAYGFSLGWLAVALGVASAAACSAGGSGGSAGADAGPTGPQLGTLPIAGPDVDPPADIKLGSDVVIVHGGLSTLTAVSPNHGVWTLAKSGSGVSNLAVGKILLLAGLDVARVTAMEDMGDSVNVTVAPVAITDVIQDGSWSWTNFDVDMTKGIAVEGAEAFEVADDPLDAGALDSGTNPKVIEEPHPLGLGVENPAKELSITIGNWKIAWSATLPSTGGVDMKVEATVNGSGSGTAGKITSLGAISGVMNVSTHLNSLSGSSGSVHVSGSTLSGSNLSIPLNGTVSLGFSATTPSGSQYPKAALVKLPLSLEFAFPGPAGIPVYAYVQTNLYFQPSLATVNSGFQLETGIAISGTAGISFDNGSLKVTSVPTIKLTSGSPLNSLTTTPSAGAIAMVASVEAPRIGLGLGTLSFLGGVKAGLFVDAISSLGITVAPYTSAIPCREVTLKATVGAGGEIGIQIFNGTSVGREQSVTLYTYPTDGGPKPWYTPMVPACKP
jgi:hypothetical protein